MSKRRITHHTLTWTHPISGKPRSVELVHTRNYLNAGSDHLEIRSIRPRSAPHPLSPTGYRSHVVPAAELKAAGGAVQFVTQWLAREARSKDFVAAVKQRLQGDLFTWVNRRPPWRPGSKSPRPRASRHPR